MAAALHYIESDWLLLKYPKSSEISCIYLPFKGKKALRNYAFLYDNILTKL
jgi:hypothetical protein